MRRPSLAACSSVCIAVFVLLPACTGVLSEVAEGERSDGSVVVDASDPSDATTALDGAAEMLDGSATDGSAPTDSGSADAASPSDAGADAWTPGCVASPEVCNGVDDDCDLIVDEALTMTCGSSVGVCATGTVMCADGAFPTCVPRTRPSAETCDGRDEDCDGNTDEAVAAMACGTDTGRCVAGTRRCSGGSFGACMGSTGARAEVCDGIDDDCDGRVDEGVAARACGTDVGTCRRGTQACTGGGWGACTGSVGPRAELDDGLDNDCDGVIDNGIPCESAIEGAQRAATNAERTSRGLRALTCDRGLRRAARKYAQVLCTRGPPLSHVGPDGSTFRSRIDAEGVVYTLIGENIAQGYATAAAVTAGWMGSPPHRANILNAGFGRVGVGYVACGGMHYWVQNFAD